MEFYLYKSDKPAKKYYVEFTNLDTARTNRIYFGAAGYPDFILSGGDEEKKTRYISRHESREDWSSPYAGAGFWSRWILWNRPTLKSSINDTKERFNIKIINKTKSNTGGNIASQKPSAYRSMKLAEKRLTKPITQANRGALLNWGRELWLNLNALRDLDIKLPCGTKYKGQTEPTVCRPSIRINDKTSKPLASELTDKQITKAIAIKKKMQRINWSKL